MNNLEIAQKIDTSTQEEIDMIISKEAESRNVSFNEIFKHVGHIYHEMAKPIKNEMIYNASVNVR